jgi:hypothetical protein
MHPLPEVHLDPPLETRHQVGIPAKKAMPLWSWSSSASSVPLNEYMSSHNRDGLAQKLYPVTSHIDFDDAPSL